MMADQTAERVDEEHVYGLLRAENKASEELAA